MAFARDLKEPRWHRRLRSARSRVRAAFKCNIWKLWSYTKFRKAARFLEAHHGSQIPLRVRQTILGKKAFLMASNSWTCRFCAVQMTLIVAHCSICNRHWKQAQQSTASRSKSRRSRKAKESNNTTERNSKSAVGDSDKTRTEDKNIFGDQHPWVMSSPQPRTMASGSGQTVVESTHESALPIPPQIKPSDPPEMNQESVLTHLRGLKKAMGTLREALEVQLKSLEEQAKDRMLSHGHLNKLSKLQRQLTALHSRIQEMDSNWHHTNVVLDVSAIQLFY